MAVRRYATLLYLYYVFGCVIRVVCRVCQYIFTMCTWMCVCVLLSERVYVFYLFTSHPCQTIPCSRASRQNRSSSRGINALAREHIKSFMEQQRDDDDHTYTYYICICTLNVVEALSSGSIPYNLRNSCSSCFVGAVPHKVFVECMLCVCVLITPESSIMNTLSSVTALIVAPDSF